MIDESFAERLRLEPLAGLRALREGLREEERQVSYWRRLVQGHLDLARAALAGDQPSDSRRSAATMLRKRSNGRRSPAFVRLAEGATDCRLASLAGLGDTPIPWEDREQLQQVERNLVTIETELSGCRRDLHERLDACTAELVGRYRRDPGELRSLRPSSQ